MGDFRRVTLVSETGPYSAAPQPGPAAKASKLLMGEMESIVGTTPDFSKPVSVRPFGIAEVRRRLIPHAAVDLGGHRRRLTSELLLQHLGTPVLKRRNRKTHTEGSVVDRHPEEERHNRAGPEDHHPQRPRRPTADDRPRRHWLTADLVAVQSVARTVITIRLCHPAPSATRKERSNS